MIGRASQVHAVWRYLHQEIITQANNTIGSTKVYILD